eukprot:CAMPEP_0196639694 /NCGR_PEP_ID=MMETSP1085-20130531/2215_1 /TAXON_ID=41879 ORGANISM="Pycnococcus sp, Strain CCMP1998" /NCGR_SAMPLE_ID=MMETSP1085 /ASSEMBLY_ACC=CAM_ASM_000807 /LENGTH=146 /DNA_ID=CAMNT_0041968771 /DNA_START=16 /DNA_END=456 /DNA_ORIENTATION=+
MARQLGAFAATLRGLCSASGRGAGSDEVVLRGLSFYARHGVLPAEAELGQNFVVDLKLGCCLQRAGTLDDVSSTVDYSAVYREVKSVVVEGRRHQLIESLATDIVERVLEKFGQVHHVDVFVKKPQVALMGQLEYAGVRLRRSRVE